ncbi:MAG TPA: TRAP transporter large permease subunit, partial [Desulfomonilaceae bacterium]|nr:TRAP transporter large permease subunit [Desulfomonilaceae bacterium]
MEWWAVLVLFLAGIIAALVSGLPIAFAFLLVDVIGVLCFMGPQGLTQITLQIFSSLSTFTLTPIPLFILMGELLFHSGMAYKTLDVMDTWLGRIPGRLSVLAAASGTMFAAMSGSTIANTAMLGTVLLPEMRRRDYATSMAVGPIVAAGPLAALIPPSSLAVVLASIARIPVGDMLLGGVGPGVLLGLFFCIYIMIRCRLNPSLAPHYERTGITFRERFLGLVVYVLPLGSIIFSVLGLMILGVATPTEAAASGALVTVAVAACYGKLTRKMVIDSLVGTLEITIMVFMIIAASNTFSSLLAYTGATTGLVTTVQGLQVSPLMILVGMNIVVLIMGCFMETIAIMMITLPIFMPIITALGFNPVWFGVIMLVNCETGMLTPPFGMLLFVMKGVAPPDITMQDIIRAAFPYIVIYIASLA